MIQSGLCFFATVLYASHATYWVFLVFCLAILVCMLRGAYQVWRSTDGQGLRQSERWIACLEQVLLPCSLIFPILFCVLVAYYFLRTEPDEDEEESKEDEEVLNDAEMVTDESDSDEDEDGEDEFEQEDEFEEDDDEPDVTEDEEEDESEEVKLGEEIDESKKENQPSEGENPTE